MESSSGRASTSLSVSRLNLEISHAVARSVAGSKESSEPVLFHTELLIENGVDGGIPSARSASLACCYCPAHFPAWLATRPFDGADDPVARRGGERDEFASGVLQGMAMFVLATRRIRAERGDGEVAREGDGAGGCAGAIAGEANIADGMKIPPRTKNLR
jgi:hypothetical protein